MSYFSIPRSGLVGEFLLDSNANDTNDGTKNNGTATNVTYVSSDVGYQKQAGSFNGSNARIDFANPINGTRSGFSLSVNLKSGGTSGDQYVLASLGSPVEIIKLNAGAIRFRVYQGSSILICDGPDCTDKHHLLTYEWDTTQGNAKLYVDGVLYSTSSDSRATNLTLNNANYSIGTYYGGSSNWFNGSIACMRIFNRVLTDTERLQLWHEFNRKLGGGSDFGAYVPAPTNAWNMNGDVLDNASQLDMTSSGVTYSDAGFGTFLAAEGNGSSKYATQSTFLDAGSTDWTFAFRFKTTVSARMELLHKSDTGSLCPFYANLNFSATGKLSILTDNSGTYATFASASNVNDGNWKTVVVSGGGGVGEMMINGTVDATTATLARSIVSSSTRDFQFMRRWDGAYYFNGMCGPVYFWNSKLTTEQKRLVTQYIESGRYPYAFRRSIPANIRSKLRLHYAGYQSGTTVYDMSGNGNNGTSVGSPTIARSQQNTCLLFNGSSQYVNGPTFDTGNDFAVSCWFKPTTTASEQVFFANAQGSGSSLQGFFFLYDPSNKLRLTEYMPSFSNRDLYTGTLTLTANKWYLCTCVIRGGTVYEIYLNDHLEATQTGTDKTSYNQASRFGAYSHTTASYITGPSECFVWNTAPSQQEIQQLYYATHRN